MNTIQVKQANNLIKFNSNEIIRLKASSNYTFIYLTGNKKILTTKVLHNYEPMLLSEGFLRIHNSHIVNCSFIKEVDKMGNVCLTDNTIINIARRRRKDIFKILNFEK